MDNNRTEYIFRVCGCRSDKFVYQNKSRKLKLCVKHGTRLESKVRWCSVCGAETICSTYSSSKKFVCPTCRRANSIAVKRIRESKLGARVTTGFRANAGIKRNPELEMPVAVRVLDKKFPPLPKPELSKEMQRVYNDNL